MYVNISKYFVSRTLKYLGNEKKKTKNEKTKQNKNNNTGTQPPVELSAARHFFRNHLIRDREKKYEGKVLGNKYDERNFFIFLCVCVCVRFFHHHHNIR